MSELREKVKAVLGLLNVSNDSDWTDDGLPRLDTINKALDEKITRAQLTELFPKFLRTSPDFSEADPPPPAPEQAEESAPAFVALGHPDESKQTEIEALLAQIQEIEHRQFQIQEEKDKLEKENVKLGRQSQMLSRELDSLRGDPFLYENSLYFKRQYEELNRKIAEASAQNDPKST